MLVTISGLPGSGTSTVARQVAEGLGLDRIDGGSVFRAMAREHGHDLAAFSALAEHDPSFDLELDQRLAAYARAGGIVLESRLAGWIAANEQVPATKVWIAADEDERARRVAEREGLSDDEARAANARRADSERLRYRTYYDIDLDDLTVYDLVLDSTHEPPKTLVKSIIEASAV